MTNPIPTDPPQHRWAMWWCRCGAELDSPQEAQHHVELTGHLVVWEEHLVWVQTLVGPPRHPLGRDVIHTLPQRGEG
jgi:hypothetical protein